MTVTTPVTNSRPQRKLLSDQLDRLDSIIDALAEGLPQAIAAATREGTREAVKDAIVEIVSNPELRKLLQPPPPPVQTPSEQIAPKPSLWTRIKAGVAAMKVAVLERVIATKNAVVETTRRVTTALPLKRVLGVTAAVGLAMTAAIYLARARVSSMFARIGGAVAGAAIQVGAWFRRSARTLLATG